MILPYKIRGVVKRNIGRGKKLGFPTANLDAPQKAADGIYFGYTRVSPESTYNLPKHDLSAPSGHLPSKGEKNMEEVMQPPTPRMGLRIPSLIFIGAALTFGDTQRFAESYILDFHGDLYDKEIELELLEYVREGRKFASVEEMSKQISEDERLARIYFGI